MNNGKGVLPFADFLSRGATTVPHVDAERQEPCDTSWGRSFNKETDMATTIIRYTNRYAFEIKGDVDVNSDVVNVEDCARVEEDKLYFVFAKKSGYAYRHELGIQTIGGNNYQRCLLHGYTPEIFDVGGHMEELLKTGHCALRQNNYDVEVYVGKHFAPFFEEEGKESLAKCYAEIAQKRKEHADYLDQTKKLLAVGSNAPATEDPADNLVEDIKWFLDNRKQIKEMCK